MAPSRPPPAGSANWRCVALDIDGRRFDARCGRRRILRRRILRPIGARRGEYLGRFSRRQAHGGLNAGQPILPETQHVLVGNASDETRRGGIGGIALGIGRGCGVRRGAAMRLVPKQQHLVKRHGNILEHAAERRDEQIVPIVRGIRRYMRRRRRRRAIGRGNSG